MKAQMNFPSLDAPSWQQPIACPQHVLHCTVRAHSRKVPQPAGDGDRAAGGDAMIGTAPAPGRLADSPYMRRG